MRMDSDGTGYGREVDVTLLDCPIELLAVDGQRRRSRCSGKSTCHLYTLACHHFDVTVLRGRDARTARLTVAAALPALEGRSRGEWIRWLDSGRHVTAVAFRYFDVAVFGACNADTNHDSTMCITSFTWLAFYEVNIQNQVVSTLHYKTTSSPSS